MRITTRPMRQNVPKRSIVQRAFLIFEGHRTEVDYFSTLANMRSTAKLSDGVEVIVLDRFEHESGLSDPFRVLKLSKEYIRFLEMGVMTTQLLAGYCIECAGIKEHQKTFFTDLNSELEKRGLVTEGVINDLIEAKDIAKIILHKYGFEDVDLIIERIDYDRECDTVNIIVDRDMSKSRPEDRYLSFLEECRNEGFITYVTNPKFELWILCHYDGVSESLGCICESANPSSVLDREMKKIGYRKKDVQFPPLIRKLDLALKNSKVLEKDVEALVSDVGTNLPALIRELRENRY